MNDKNTDAVTRRRNWSPGVVSLATIAALAVVGVIVFAIFGLGIRSVRTGAEPVSTTTAPVPSGSSTATPNPNSSAPVTASAAGETVPEATSAAKPEQLFDGDCAQIYSTAEVSALTGKPMELASGASVTGQYGGQLEFAIEQAGGLSCYWFVKSDTFSSSSPQVQIVAVPQQSARPLETELTCGPGYTEAIAGPGACGIEQEESGIRFSGGVMGASAANGKKLAASVIERLNERANATGHVDTKRVPGAWTNPVDCDALAKKLDVTSVFGPDGTFGEDGLGHGTYGPPVGGELTSGYETLTCSATTAGEQLVTSSYRFGILGGGAWVRDELKDSSEVTIDGIGEAYDVGGVLYVFTGPNLLTLEYTFGSAPGEFADAAVQVRALVAALDSE